MDYYSTEADFQHIKLALAFPVKLTATATLTPYVAGNIALDTTEDFTDDEIYGGVKLSVSFYATRFGGLYGLPNSSESLPVRREALLFSE